MCLNNKVPALEGGRWNSVIYRDRGASQEALGTVGTVLNGTSHGPGEARSNGCSYNALLCRQHPCGSEAAPLPSCPPESKVGEQPCPPPRSSRAAPSSPTASAAVSVWASPKRAVSFPTVSPHISAWMSPWHPELRRDPINQCFTQRNPSALPPPHQPSCACCPVLPSCLPVSQSGLCSLSRAALRLSRVSPRAADPGRQPSFPSHS